MKTLLVSLALACAFLCTADAQLAVSNKGRHYITIGTNSAVDPSQKVDWDTEYVVYLAKDEQHTVGDKHGKWHTGWLHTGEAIVVDRNTGVSKRIRRCGNPIRESWTPEGRKEDLLPPAAPEPAPKPPEPPKPEPVPVVVETPGQTTINYKIVNKTLRETTPIEQRLEVSPANRVVTRKESAKFIATFILGTTRTDVTTDSAWLIADKKVGCLQGPGEIKGCGIGSTAINVNYRNLPGVSTLIVNGSRGRCRTLCKVLIVGAAVGGIVGGVVATRGGKEAHAPAATLPLPGSR